MYKFLFAIITMLFATAAVAQSEYRIQPGDTLQVEVLEDPSLNRSILVLPDGTVSFPFAGSLSAGNRTTSQVAGAITSAISPNFSSAPTVFVNVAALSEVAAGSGGAHSDIHIFLMGEITTPGRVHMDRGTTLVQALAQTGGFTPYAATKRIILRRTDPKSGSVKTHKLNYRAIEQGAGTGRDIRLRDGDVIIVPQRRLFE
jgi:polysaccharide export outer membrane protein